MRLARTCSAIISFWITELSVAADASCDRSTVCAAGDSGCSGWRIGEKPQGAAPACAEAEQSAQRARAASAAATEQRVPHNAHLRRERAQRHLPAGVALQRIWQERRHSALHVKPRQVVGAAARRRLRRCREVVAAARRQAARRLQLRTQRGAAGLRAAAKAHSGRVL